MRAIADGAQAVQGGNTESAGEISVRAAAGSAFAQREVHLPCEGLRTSVKRSAVLAFQRRAIEAAGDFQLCAYMDRTQSVKPAFDAAHIGSAQGTQIENGAGAFRDHIGAGTSF